MTKQEFITELRDKLGGASTQDIEERLSFYDEMINDIVEEGKTEEEAVADIGAVDDIASQIKAELRGSYAKNEKAEETKKIKNTKNTDKNGKRRLKVWAIVLLAIGSPIWLSLLIAFLAVIISLGAALWSLVASAWAVFASVALSSLAGLALGVLYICSGLLKGGLALIGVAHVLAGLAVFAFFGCIAATKGVATLTKLTVSGAKRLVFGKDGAR